MAESSTYKERVRGRAQRERQRAILDAEAASSRNSQGDLGTANPHVNENEGLLCVDELLDWERDPGERARRIYQWWVSFILVDKDPIRYFSEALRLIVMVQPSSSAVERVFSQLQFIRHICGDRMLSDLLNLRLMIRVNDVLVEDYKT